MHDIKIYKALTKCQCSEFPFLNPIIEAQRGSQVRDWRPAAHRPQHGQDLFLYGCKEIGLYVFKVVESRRNDRAPVLSQELKYLVSGSLQKKFLAPDLEVHE